MNNNLVNTRNNTWLITWNSPRTLWELLGINRPHSKGDIPPARKVNHFYLSHLYIYNYIYICMEVSWNGGTPKSSIFIGFHRVFIGFSMIKTIKKRGSPMDGNLHSRSAVGRMKHQDPIAPSAGLESHPPLQWPAQRMGWMSYQWGYPTIDGFYAEILRKNGWFRGIPIFGKQIKRVGR